MLFSDFNLPPFLASSIEQLGFSEPTPIQAEAIPPLLDGRDVVGVAQTGTGKTAAFGLPLLASLNPEGDYVQALVLAPTRELAGQTAQALKSFSRDDRRLKFAVVYGGSPYGQQIRALEEGAQVVVGTPGRVIDLLDRGKLDLSRMHFFVLDEADEMLRMGFAEDVEHIATSVPDERRTALFSATMPPAIRRVAEQHLNNPVNISVTPPASTVDTVHQTYAVVPFKHKFDALARVLAVSKADAALVFVRTRMSAEEVTADLINRGVSASALSGDVAQQERERIVERLRQGAVNVIVATDVAARGLDVERIGLVVNFDVPRDNDAYVHRIGRTGRAGREGESLTFLTPKEKSRLRQIERATGAQIEEVSIPSPKDVLRHQAKKMLQRIPNRLELGRMDILEDLIDEAQEEMDVSITDIATALLALSIGDIPNKGVSQQRDRGRNPREEQFDDEGNFVRASFEGGRDFSAKSARSRAGTRRDDHGTTYRIEVGHKDNVKPGEIVGAITNEGGIHGSEIGRIDIFPTFSLVDILVELSPEEQRTLARIKIAGRALRLRIDSGPGGGRRSGHGGSKGRDRDGFRQARRKKRYSGF